MTMRQSHQRQHNSRAKAGPESAQPQGPRLPRGQIGQGQRLDNDVSIAWFLTHVNRVIVQAAAFVSPRLLVARDESNRPATNAAIQSRAIRAAILRSPSGSLPDAKGLV